MSPIGQQEQATICTSCGTAHHLECWEENRGCCVKRCPQMTRTLDIDLPRDAPDKLVLTREAVESARPHAPARNSNPCVGCGKQVPEGELYCRECQPPPPESQDARNTWPILVILGVLAVVLAWIVVFAIPGSKPSLDTNTPGVTDTADR